LRHARHQHDRADLECIVIADIGEEHRHQVGGAEQAGAEAEAQRATDRERAGAQCLELHDWMDRFEGSEEERQHRDASEDEQQHATCR